MIEYGYIENGYLRAKPLEPITLMDKDPETGIPIQKVISVEDQIKELPPEWKPVDPIDEDRMQPSQEGMIVRLVPYDAGDRISYHYQEIPDTQAKMRKIQALKDELAGSDYQVIKCYESSLLGLAMPYDLEALHTTRQRIRDQINALEESEK